MVNAHTLDATQLVELQAALRAGAGPAEAVAATCRGGVLEDAARRARLGQPLSAIAAAPATGHPPADFLVRCLALTERSGGGAAEAVDHALTAIRDDTELQRLLDVRTTQARGTAVVLCAVPVAAWALLVLIDPAMLSFYATPPGWISAASAAALALTAWRWMRRLIAAAGRAAARVDPLTPPAPPPVWGRGAVVGIATALLVTAVAGAAPGLAAGVAAGGMVARRRGADGAADGGAAEAVSLIAVALDSGMAPVTAFAEAASVAPAAAQPLLRSAARRMAGGWRADEALAETALAPLGATLAAAHRWGAPAGPALRALAAEMRADRRAAVEVAAERLQLALIFPTTLLTLPAFVLGIVPPLLWSTVRG